jgi:hypothetical protein
MKLIQNEIHSHKWNMLSIMDNRSNAYAISAKKPRKASEKFWGSGIKLFNER